MTQRVGPELRSKHSDDPAFVTFFNNTDRIIDVIWYDFVGTLVRYGRLLPDQTLDVNTYSEHLFKCFDNTTGIELLCNGQPVFYPESFRQIHQRLQMVHASRRSHICRRSLVVVTTPLRSLMEISEQFLMRYITCVDEIHLLDLPHVLRRRLITLLEKKTVYSSRFGEFS